MMQPAPRSGSQCWFAESVENDGTYAAGSSVSFQRMTTKNPLEARRFPTEKKCEAYCASWNDDGNTPPLHPTEHSFV